MTFAPVKTNYDPLAALSAIMGQTQARVDDRHMERVFAANPQFAEKLYGMKNQNSQLALMQQEAMRKQQQQDALRELAAQFANGGNAGNLIGQAAAITGDLSPLANLAISREEQAAELARKQALANAMGVKPTGFVPGQPVPVDIYGNSSGVPLNVRSNNPGNMRDVKTGVFRQFATPEEGLAAMANDLTAKVTGKSGVMKSKYGEGYKPTLQNVIETWAPPSENDTQKYVNFVAEQSGLSPTQTLSPLDIQKIMPAMVKMEGGEQAAEYFAQPAAVPVAEAAVEQPITNPALDTLRQWAEIDPEKFGPAYLQAQADDAQNQLKMVAEKEKAQKESAKNLTEGERDLRKEFEGLPDVKQFREVEASYKRINKAATKNSAAGDIALIFNYMKMLDPGSTVREGEFATAQNAAGIPTQVWNMYNKAVSGERLAPEQRADFLGQAKEQYFGAEELFNVRADQYQDLAKEYDFNPKRIVTRARQKVEADKAAAVDPALLEYMTPEERALFQ